MLTERERAEAQKFQRLAGIHPVGHFSHDSMLSIGPRIVADEEAASDATATVVCHQRVHPVTGELVYEFDLLPD